jgi:hypothetical protein
VSSTLSPRRSQAWFPGKYVPVSRISGIEVFSRRRGRVQVSDTTIHGSPAQLRALAAHMLRAADLVDRTEAA